MNSTFSLSYMIKYNVLKQIRSYHFIVVLWIVIFLGFLCVPSKEAGYQIFYMGGVRGVYNSAWLGIMASMLSGILLWLPGFYMLRSQISEDERLKIGQITAAAPISKLKFISGKAFSNFITLMMLELIFLIAFTVMQLLRQESSYLEVMDYLKPLLLITVPYLLVVSSFTVLFDVISVLKGVFGNVVIFMIWVVLSSFSVAIPDNSFDLFGIGFSLSEIFAGVKSSFPGIGDTMGGSFGYYPASEDMPTFLWSGVSWKGDFLLFRLVWIIIAVIIVCIASLVFNRFREKKRNTVIIPAKIIRQSSNGVGTEEKGLGKILTLSTVRRQSKFLLAPLIIGELKMMLKGKSFWWYLIILSANLVCFLLPQDLFIKWSVYTMLMPITIWSQMGCKDTYHKTEELMLSSSAYKIKWYAVWNAGIIVSVLVSSGILIRHLLQQDWLLCVGWLVGIVFIVTLAIVLGSISYSRRLFESIYIAVFYLGPVNHIKSFDLFSGTVFQIKNYIIVTILLFCLGLIFKILKEEHVIKPVRR